MADARREPALHVGPEHLRKHQETASRYILEQLGLEWTDGEWPPRLATTPADAL
ncbi:hypothetical protein [Pseudomonas aeruginosa]|uniref:hypothetical protein n=1 Tax=Pseudomonas aeruginosa TaxID=287 RepID=UPI002738F156|nr:hypothetical protein [Pseudomonas aeruginosa]